MLGAIIAQHTGKLTGLRVIASDNDGTKLEVTAQGEGTFQGTTATFLTTYTQIMYPGGRIYGEGRSVAMTGDGRTETWTGFAMGKRTGQGFAITAATCGTLLGTAAVGEYNTDQAGDY